MKKLLFTLCLVATFGFAINAQINTPAASPSCKVEQTVGLTKVTLEYSRPGVKGRTIFAADGLVPYGEQWRTGANAASKVTFSDDVKVDGKDLAKGSYAILTVPGETEWKVMLHKYEKGSWSSYKDKTPTLTVSAKPTAMPWSVESFTMGVGNIANNSAEIHILWEKVMIAIPFSTEFDSKVMADIEKTMAGPGRGDYYSAARYYYDSGKDSAQALAWIKKANEIDAKFWQLRLESQILAGMGKHIDAIEAAERSKALAMKAENKDYVRRNDKAIAEWKAILAKKSSDKKSGK